VRRLALITATLAAALAAVTAALLGARAPSAQGSSGYTFDAVFDDARGLVAGQLIKIAGASAGSIEKVSITPDFKARIQMSVGARFAPFRVDAHCTIRPQGLIAENYVDCNPGSRTAPPLRAQDGFPPTVPVGHTTEPVNLLDLFDIANLPTAERFSIIVNELGIGLSGNGENLNDVILRANPALASARRVLGLLSSQRAALGTAIDSSDRVVSELANHSPAVSRFVSAAARTASVTGAHHQQLAQAVARLPGLLRAARPALAHLDAVAQTGTPLLAQVHHAAPQVNRLTAELTPFARAVAPVLKQLTPVLAAGTRTAVDARPLLGLIARYARISLPNAISTGKLFVSLREHGFSEAFLGAVYYMAATLSRFDGISHFAAATLTGNQCSLYVGKPTPGCSAHLGGTSSATGIQSTAPSSTSARAGNLLDYLLK
jgi:virulence factor Mce-like protein